MIGCGGTLTKTLIDTITSIHFFVVTGWTPLQVSQDNIAGDMYESGYSDFGDSNQISEVLFNMKSKSKLKSKV